MNHTILTSTVRQRHWSTVDFPTLRPRGKQEQNLYPNPVSNAQKQYLSLKGDSRACAPPYVIFTTCGGRTVWFRPSDEDLLKYTFHSLQTSFVHTHLALLSWCLGITKISDSSLCLWMLLVHPSSQPKNSKSRNHIHLPDEEAEIQRLRYLPKYVTKATWL